MSHDLSGIIDGDVTERKARGCRRDLLAPRRIVIPSRLRALQVLPAQYLWRREKCARPGVKSGDQELAEPQNVRGGEWSDFAGHDLRRSSRSPSCCSMTAI